MHSTSTVSSPRYRHRQRRVTVTATVTASVVTAALGTALLTGCARSSMRSLDSGGHAKKGKITVSVGVFGVFGYKQAGLYDEYEQLNPKVKIRENSTAKNVDYYPALLKHLSAGSGLSDVQAVEVGNISEIAGPHADEFVDVGKQAGVRESDWLPWRWDQARNRSGKVVGLGTDIGPMGICYRKDLFKKAGLPTERDAVGKLWAGDWGKYVDMGEKYMQNAPADTTFTDSAAGLYNGSVSSYSFRNYTSNGYLIYKKSEANRKSWDLAMRAIDGMMTGKLEQFSKDWDKAYAKGNFASVICPPWMLGYIKEKSGPKGAGKWDVAAAPKPANWGGSFLTVPKKAKHKEEALKLIAWLTAPQQQAKLFQKQASFPSSEAAFGLPEVKDAQHEYFNDAPIGKIFSAAARDMPTAVLGPKDQLIQTSISNIGILQVEQKGTPPKQAWNAAVKKIDASVKD